jgi:aquaporin Z
MSRELAAEFVGTFTLVTAVCGAALFSAPSPVWSPSRSRSACRFWRWPSRSATFRAATFNPAVTLGLVAGGRFALNRAPAYIIAQLLGGAAAALVFYVILSGAPAGKWNSFTRSSNLYGGTGFSPLSQARRATALVERR